METLRSPDNLRTPLADFLQSLPLFEGVARRHLEILVRQGKERVYQRREVIYHEEDPAGSLYFVLKGVVKVELTSPEGKRVTISWVRPRSVFGTISMVDVQARPESATALEPCEVFVIDGEQFRGFMQEHPSVSLRFLQILAQHWRTTLVRLREMAFLDVQARVAKVLVEYTRRGDLPSGGHIGIVRSLSQTEMASLVGATRESVNKHLQFFARQGWIELERRRIKILDQESLEQQITHSAMRA